MEDTMVDNHMWMQAWDDHLWMFAQDDHSWMFRLVARRINNAIWLLPFQEMKSWSW